MGDKPLLDIDGLSIDFATPAGPLHALRDVHLAVEPGTITGIVGESGCGKSTLINSVIGLLPANARRVGGEVRFDGRDILGLGSDALRDLRGNRITAVFQDPMTALNPVLTVGDQMTAIQYRSGASRRQKWQRAVDYLAKVRIPDPERRMEQYPHQFSGGMRQRICIAMALLAEPDLLIADEPTTALDATLEVEVIGLLKELQREAGCAVLFISHHLGAVAELCEEVAIMYAGEVVERGSVRDIFHNARHPYARALLTCDPGRVREASRQLPTIPGTLPDLRHPPEGCIFRPRCPESFERCAQKPPAHWVTPTHWATCHKAETLPPLPRAAERLGA
ncbi:MAG: peptide ABC transporter ATP-binding protein [Mesorhizobium amorphae]|nr:MAG: peptide ABC transporter ATP-binding protein [Mesorhizobium amorphae]